MHKRMATREGGLRMVWWTDEGADYINPPGAEAPNGGCKLWLLMVSEWCDALVTAVTIEVPLVSWLHGFGAVQCERMASNGRDYVGWLRMVGVA